MFLSHNDDEILLCKTDSDLLRVSGNSFQQMLSTIYFQNYLPSKVFKYAGKLSFLRT